MTTITFYSYKGGTGRSLALANAAVYLATLGFKVVALDFDLEAPGLHYKLSRNEDGSPLSVKKGVVDYVNTFLLSGQVSTPLKDFIVNAPVPGIDKPLLQLMPAGQVPSNDYWSKLSRINWHELFYSKGAKGVQIFMELKARILEELRPDFLLIDSRTGITEMGGIATTLFADKIICLVLPPPENLQGARAVLRSLKRSRREIEGSELEVLIAVSRLPQMKGWEDERALTEGILERLNEEADDPKDTLHCQRVFVLHSETALQLREELRVGSGINPDDSILLRDYLRLFANFVPKESIEPKVHGLIEKAWAELRDDPDAAIKDMEVLAESFGHPETYRELLRFYQVRNVSGSLTLKRAQRLWELTGDSRDSILWQALARSFEPQPRWRADKQWSPNLDFVHAVWRNAGGKNPGFGMILATAYAYEDRESIAADVLLEVINFSGPTAPIVARCIGLLDIAKRTEEAETLIQQLKTNFTAVPEFATAWARHAIRAKNRSAFGELTKSPWAESVRPALRGLLYHYAGLGEEAVATAELAMRDLRERDLTRAEIGEVGRYFHAIGRWDEFEVVVSDLFPPEIINEFRDRVGLRARRK
jgi:MinD-like ATPase involved in chromosome partitioning or flagellar assembly